MIVEMLEDVSNNSCSEGPRYIVTTADTTIVGK